MKLLDEKEAISLYEEVVDLVEKIYKKAQLKKKLVEEDKDIINCVKIFVDQQYLDNDNILNLINLTREDNYILYHVVNVCIISIDIGLGLGYDKPKLYELGISAILHDIGMIRLYDIYKLPRKLSIKEYKKIKTHPLLGAKVLEKFKNLSKKTISAVSQEHERMNGSGYPHGLKGRAIDEYAKIIGLADVYEAMTHVRPYRNKIHPFETLKQIIDTKDTFEKNIIKVLIERLGCPFPLNSYVKLSTGEKGRVIKRNLKNPFRPTVEAAYDAKGQKLREPRIIDLAEYPTVYIKRHLKNSKD